MTVNEWRFKICVKARDEWRKNPQRYNGMCPLLINTIIQNGYEETDDKEFNKLMLALIRHRGCSRPTVSELIPAFVRPDDANSGAFLFGGLLLKNNVAWSFLSIWYLITPTPLIRKVSYGISKNKDQCHGLERYP